MWLTWSLLISQASLSEFVVHFSKIGCVNSTCDPVNEWPNKGVWIWAWCMRLIPSTHILDLKEVYNTVERLKKRGNAMDLFPLNTNTTCIHVLCTFKTQSTYIYVELKKTAPCGFSPTYFIYFTSIIMMINCISLFTRSL